MRRNVIISAVFLLGSAAFSNASYAEDKPHALGAHSHTEFVKPGAAVSMTHDYDGHTEPGEIEYITLRLEYIYQDGFLSLSLKTGQGLDMMSSTTPQSLRLTPGSKLSIPVQFSSRQNGTHFISLDAIYESPQGALSRRTLSLAVNIGSPASEKAQAKTAQFPAKTSSGLIIMNAQEEIK
ncbi:hypothetical protein [Hellea balneolensis]|uniref:hypothetical protein n=1 Tax=Hellea balneolensis TaxID=287478 RepID=UPI00047C4411|nr:hypothetical protein [Hellea balneolensis]